MNQLNRAHRALRIARVDIHQHNFRALVFKLTQHAIARPVRKPDVVQHRMRHVRAFDARIKDDGLLAILGEDGDCDSPA